jgi:hypothetical protein
MAQENGEVVFRKRPFRMFLDVLLLLFWGLMALVFAAGLFHGDPEIEARTSYFGVFVMILVVAGGIFYLVRIVKVRGPLLRITPQGIIYALDSAELVPWSRVTAVTVERGLRWTYPSYVILFLRDGAVIEIECEFFTLKLDRVLAAIRPYCDVEA